MELKPAKADVSDYTLAEGDVLEFDILDDVDPPRQIVVSNDGRVQIPLLGSVSVANMTLSEARNEVRQKFLERELLNDPQIGLSVVNFRPIFVLGDVKTPGAYPFQTQLTVEKAVGLAGGVNTGLSNTEDRILTRVRVSGELQGYESDLAREAVWAARLTAQLDDRTEIAMEDIPKNARPLLNEQLLAPLRQREQAILKVDAEEYASQTKLVTQAIKETEDRSKILDQMAENQKEAVKYSKDDYQRVKKGRDAGNIVADSLSRAQRQLTADEGRLLQIYSDMSDARRQSTSFRRELSQLQSTRKKDTLSQLQERHAAIEKLLVSRATAGQQLLAVSNLIAADTTNSPKFKIQYKIRHLSNGKMEQLLATGTTDLTPGDIVYVAVESLQSAPVNQTSSSSTSVLQ